jgi:phosphoadenosine phosphosulfate reductase
MGPAPGDRARRDMSCAAARAEAVRTFGPPDAEQLSEQFGGEPTERLLKTVLGDPRFGAIAVVSSFGAESAVLLHLVSEVDPGVPVILLETGKLFPETLAYSEALRGRLGLRDVRHVQPDPDVLAARDPNGLRWSFDPDGCCAIRKVAPLAGVLAGVDLSLSGRKRHQGATRMALPLFEADGERLKLNPLAGWTREMLLAHMERHGLPPHPLVAEGYASIGCSPCTSPVRDGEDPRAGRWRGWEKTECGIHGDGEPAF